MSVKNDLKDSVAAGIEVAQKNGISVQTFISYAIAIVAVVWWLSGSYHAGIQGDSTLGNQIKLVKLEIEQDRETQRENNTALRNGLKEIGAAVRNLAETSRQQIEAVRLEAVRRDEKSREEAKQRVRDIEEKARLASSDRYHKRDAVKKCMLDALANPGWVCHNPAAGEPEYFYVGMGRVDEGSEWRTTVRRSTGNE